MAEFLHETYPWWAIALGLALSAVTIVVSELVMNWRQRRILEQYRG